MGKKKRLNSMDRLTLETTASYWEEINEGLVHYKCFLEDEVEKCKETMPDSFTYWTLSSMLSDATSVSDLVHNFLMENHVF